MHTAHCIVQTYPGGLIEKVKTPSETNSPQNRIAEIDLPEICWRRPFYALPLLSVSPCSHPKNITRSFIPSNRHDNSKYLLIQKNPNGIVCQMTRQKKNVDEIIKLIFVCHCEMEVKTEKELINKLPPLHILINQ